LRRTEIRWKTLNLSAHQFMRGGATRSAMNKVSDLRRSESGGIVSAYQILTLYFPAFILALGYSIASGFCQVVRHGIRRGFACYRRSRAWRAGGGDPDRISCRSPRPATHVGYLMNRFGRKTTMGPGFISLVS
jgi:hypothetical protein